MDMEHKKFLALFFFAAALIGQACQSTKHVAGGTAEDSVVVFEPDSVYTSARIPALVMTKKQSLLAFCEGRIGSASDWADMNLVMRRSTDDGKTWSNIVIIDSNKKAPVGNPVPIVDDRGTVHLLYQKDYNEAFYTFSTDDGLTWSAPVNITRVYEDFRPRYDWKVLAPGPGHGIQLRNGRLLSAVWLANSAKLTPRRSHHPSCVTTIYSDDLGKTWKLGEMVADNSPGIANPNESMPVQLPDGKVLLSIRNPSPVKRRAFSTSNDGISNWSPARFEEELFDPVCMASIISVPAGKKGQQALLFINPDSRNIEKTPRKNLTAKLSFDNGETWPAQMVLDSGASGYSDVAVGKNGQVYCLYETNTNGNKGFNYSLVLKKFNVGQLLKNRK